MLETAEKPRRAMVVAVHLSEVRDEEFDASLAELRQLARTLGVEVVGTLTQKRGSFDGAAYIGEGKRTELKELKGTDEDPKFDLVLVEHEITPSQSRNLEKEIGCDVMDRTQVILEIFQHHARSPVAKAQVEIVRLKYEAPRLRESGKGKDRQRGGIGNKGAGESSIELDRRKLRDRIAELNEQLEQLGEEQRQRRARRADSEVARVALVGYTNAGKSTWMRALTGSDVYVADKLFATLDTTVRALTPESVPRILVSDTVGFIRNLPHGLVASFKSTLDEALDASLLLHVVDASDPDYERQLEVTDKVLDEIGASGVPRLLVFNKIDKVPDETAASLAILRRWPAAKVLSALRPDDVNELHRLLVAHFSLSLVEEELRVAWDKQRVRGEIFASCQVLSERADDEAAYFRVRASPTVLEKLKALLA